MNVGRIVLVLLAIGLTGCGLPNAGPATSDVLDSAKERLADDSIRTHYELVDIDNATVDAMSLRPPDSFLAAFGDYRPPIEPRVGLGDTISVTIWEAAAGGLFSTPAGSDRNNAGSKSATIPDQVVARDGTIVVPYAGPLKVLGRSTHAVEGQIVTALTGKAIEPQALVVISRSVSNAVSVTGDVNSGGRIPLSVKGDRLLDILASAGGPRASVSDLYVRLARGSRTASVPLRRVVDDPRQNIYMRPDDVLALVQQPQTFMATGATLIQREIPFDGSGITLSQALAKAGGASDNRADPKGVFVFRYESRAVLTRLNPKSALLKGPGPYPVVYRLDLKDPTGLLYAQRFPIFDKDVLYISDSFIVTLQKAFQVFDTIAAPASLGSSVASVAR